MPAQPGTTEPPSLHTATMKTSDGPRVALVTGGSRGIGAGIAKRLAADGARVAFTYTSSAAAANQMMDEISRDGGAAMAIRADAAVESDVLSSVRETVRHFGPVDIFVNNAGVGGLYPLDEMSISDIDRMLSVNVRAMILATQEVLTRMGQGGRIINIGSVNADRMPIPGGSVYSSTKGAVAGFTRGLARELAPRGITINNVQPGPVDTDLNSATGPQSSLMLDAMAVTRFGSVQEVAALVAFLASPAAAFITGTSVTIDGGFSA